MRIGPGESFSVEEGPIRHLFYKILNALFNENILSFDFKFKEVTFTQNETKRVLHGLSVTPYDIIQTSKVGPGTVVFDYTNFTNTEIIITCSGLASGESCRVRFLYGKFRE